MICPRCGNEISDTVKFCPVCGNPGADTADLHDETATAGSGTDNKEIMTGTTERKTGKNGFAIAALIMGIVAIPCDYVLLIPSILAIIFSIIGITKASSAGCGRGMSVAGLILGIIAAVLWVTVTVIGITLLGVVISIMNF